MGYLKSIGTVIIYIGLFLAVITFLPGLPPEAEFSEYSIKVPADTRDRFELKNRLQGAEVLFSGKIKGPESFASYNGELYTGIHGGYVVKIKDDRIVPIVKFGQKCDGLWQEEKCGRPLGLQFNNKGELFVADSYYGIFKVDVNTRQYINIVNSSEPIDGKVPRIVNSLDIAKNGDIYWVDSSTDFPLYDGIYTFLANPSGRLIRYNAVTKKNEVLIQNLGFGNGVLLSDDESFVIVLESLKSRIIKYHLKGPKAGQQEIIAEALPGLPDNVYSDGQGGFLISLLQSVDPQHPFLPQSLMPHPYIRKMLLRLLYLVEAPFKLLEDVYPNYFAERVLHSVGSFNTAKILDVKQTSIILRMDKAGNVLDALYSEDGKVYDISSAYVHNGYLWFGSPWNDHLMRVPLKQAFPNLIDSKKSENIKEQLKDKPLPTVTKLPNVKVETKPTNAKTTAQETTPKPTTTATPKPTTKIPTQKSATDATTTKSTTQKITTTQSHPTTTTPKPPSSSTTSKASVKETKKDNIKEVKKDTLKEIKKENNNLNVNKKASNVKLETPKKDNEATVKSKSDESVKKNVRETQSEKSKPVEKKSDSTKK